MYDENSDTDSQKNPFYFRHNKIRDLTLDISGTKFSKLGMKWGFSEREYNITSVYYELATASGAVNDFPFDFTNFVETYSIFLFDVTKSRYGHLYTSPPRRSRTLTEPFFSGIRHCANFKAFQTVRPHSAPS
jgi:hypothetical protein